MATYTDQFYSLDPGNPPPVGTVLNFSSYDLLDNDDDGDIGTDGNDRVDGRKVLDVYNGDTITVENPDGSIQTITGTTFYLAGNIRVFTPTDGTVLQDGAVFLSSTFVNTSTQLDVGDLGPACFVRGTLIDTINGPRPVEMIRAGDKVRTRDSGPQEVLWVSERKAPGDEEHAPIRIRKGVLGNTADLFVSPQHRVLIDGWRAEMLFGEQEVLVAAKHLCGQHDGVHVAPRREVEYFHLLLDGHHLIWSEGALTESFDPSGDFAQLDPVARAEIEEACPGLLEKYRENRATPCVVVRGNEAQAIFA